MIAGNQKNILPPLEVLKWLFRYDSESGKLYKIRESSGKLCNPEREINALTSNGYLRVTITDRNGLKKLFLVHQLIYYMVSNVEPLSIVDHINGDKMDNRFENLKLSNESLNQRNRKMQSNNTSGITGIYWDKDRNKWASEARDPTGRKKYLGRYDDIEEAKKVISAFYSNPENNYSERHGL